VSKKTDKHNRQLCIGLYRRHSAGATVRQLAQFHDKPESWISKRIKIGERFCEQKP
jgi:hypothetical protein